jgi:hypothetical protein
MSAHDPRATLHQIQDAARHAQEICTGKTLEALLATVEQMLKDL